MFYKKPLKTTLLLSAISLLTSLYADTYNIYISSAELQKISGRTYIKIASKSYPKKVAAKITRTIKLVEGDIAKQTFNTKPSAIVNAANKNLSGGAGVCGAIFKAAGEDALTKACDTYKDGCPKGHARITPSYNIKNNGGADCIIHAVGPTKADTLALYKAYYNSLRLADKYKISAIAFPAISTGIFGYQVEDATPIALEAITTYFEEHPKSSITEIRLVTYKQSQDRMKKGGFAQDYWVYAKNLNNLVTKKTLEASESDTKNLEKIKTILAKTDDTHIADEKLALSFTLK